MILNKNKKNNSNQGVFLELLVAAKNRSSSWPIPSKVSLYKISIEI